MLRIRQLVILLTILILMLAGLLAVYYLVVNPSEKKAEVKGLVHLYSIYGWGSKPDQLLKRPHGVAVDAEKNIYVTDASSRVIVFTENGDFVRTFGGSGKVAGSLRGPLGITVDAKNSRVYVADRVRFRLIGYTTKGKFLFESSVLSPVTPLVFKDKIYVATYGPIVIYSLNGKQLDSWGSRGQKAGQFDYPHGLAADSKGNIYVSDTNNTRLVVLSKRGEPIGAKGLPPSGAQVGAAVSEFGLPAGMTMDDKNRLFIVDAFDFSIKAYSLSGKQIAVFGGNPGEMEGEFNYADGIAFLGDRTFAIADKFNDRIQVVRLTVPGEETLGQRIPKWAYYLLLLPLMLLLLLLGRRRTVAYSDFLDQVVVQKKARMLALVYKKVYVTPDIYERFAVLEEDGFELSELLRMRKFSTAKAEKLKDKYDLSEPKATYLACAMKKPLETILLSRNLALVDDGRIREVAEQAKLKSQSFEEFIRQYEVQELYTEEEEVLEEAEQSKNIGESDEGTFE